jgi:hypothetical protein
MQRNKELNGIELLLLAWCPWKEKKKERKSESKFLDNFIEE